MAGSYNAGSVDVKVNIDTSDFDKDIERLKKQTEDMRNKFKQTSDNTSTYIDNLVKTTQNLKKEQSKLSSQIGSTSSSIKEEAENLKKLSKENKANAQNVKNTVKANKDLVKSNKEVTKSLKQVEKQAKFAMTNVEKAFTKDFFKAVSKAPLFGGYKDQVAFKPIFDTLEKKYSKYTKDMQGMKRLFMTALKATGTYLTPANTRATGLDAVYFGGKENKASSAGAKAFDRVNVKNLKTQKEVKKTLQEVADVTDKVTESTKKATEATKELTTAQKRLVTPIKYTFQELAVNYEKLPKTIQTAMDNVLKAVAKKNYGEYGKKPLKKMKEDIVKQLKDIPMLDEEELFAHLNSKKSRTKYFRFPNHSLERFKEYGEYNLMRYDLGYRDYKDIYDHKYYREYKDKNINQDVLKQIAIEAMQSAKNVTFLGENLEKLTPPTEKVTTEIKELGEASKYTAGQIKVMEEIFEKASFHKNAKSVNGNSNQQYFKPLYAHLENEFIQTLTGMNPRNVINPDKLKRQFQYQLKPLFEALGISFTKEVPQNFRMDGREIKFSGTNFAGQRVGMYDVSNLINEQEFNKLIGKTVELNVELEATTKQIEKTVASTEQSVQSIKKETEAINENTCAYKTNMAVKQAMRMQAYNFLSKSAKLQDGVLNSINGQTGGRWVDKGILDDDFRVRLFDLEQFRENITNTFKEIIPSAQLKDNLRRLEHDLDIEKFTGKLTGLYDYDYDYLEREVKGITRSLDELIAGFIGVETSAIKTVNGTKQFDDATKQTIKYLQAEKEIMEALASETYNYISNLKRGRKNKGVLGTDTSLWDRWNGVAGRVKTFDMERYSKHMKKIFKGILPADVYDREFDKFKQRFKVGEVPPFEGQGGIKESYWKRLQKYEGASSVKQLKKEMGELSTVEEKATDKSKELSPALHDNVKIIKELGIELNNVNQVYLGDLLKNYDNLPSHMQQALQKTARVIEKGIKELYPKESGEYLYEFMYATKDLFPLINNIDPRYFPWSSTTSYDDAKEALELSKQFQQVFGEWYPEAYQRIMKISEYGIGNNHKLNEELSITLEIFSTLEPHIRSTAKALDTLKANGLKFMTSDQWNSPYFLNNILSDGNGFQYYSNIYPKNQKNMYYSPSDIQFLEKFFKELFNPIRLKLDDQLYPMEARHIFKYPSWRELSTSEMINMPYSHEYMSNFERTKEGYAEFVKYAQSQIMNVLKSLNIQFSNDLAIQTEEGLKRIADQRVRVWNEELGKFENIGHLDFSKMVDFGSFRTVMAYVHMLTNNMAGLKDEIATAIAEGNSVNGLIESIGETSEKSALRTTKLTYALRKLRLVVHGSLYDFNDALTTGFVRLGTINKTTKQLKELPKQLTEISASEDKTTKTTIQSDKSIKQIGNSSEKSANQIEHLREEIDKLVQASIKIGKNTGGKYIDHEWLDPQIQKLLGYPDLFRPYLLSWGEHIAPYKKGDRMWNSDAKFANRGVKGGIPLLTWEQIKKLPITKDNYHRYYNSENHPNFSPLDVYNKMYSYEELMEHFWELPYSLQHNLVEIKQIIDDRFQGRIPKNFEKAGIWQTANYDIIHGKAYSPSFMKASIVNKDGKYDGYDYYHPLPIKGIPVKQTYKMDKTAKGARKADGYVDYDKNPIYWSVKDVEEFYIAIGRLDKEIKDTAEDIKQLTGSEEKATQSTEQLVKSFQKAISQANGLQKAISKNLIPFDRIWGQTGEKGKYPQYDTPIKGILRSLMNYHNELYPNGKNDKAYKMMVDDVTAWAKQVPILNLQQLFSQFNKEAFDPKPHYPQGDIAQYYELGETIDSLINKYDRFQEVTGWGTRRNPSNNYKKSPLNTYEEGLKRILKLFDEIQIVAKGSLTNEELFKGVSKPIQQVKETIEETIPCLDSFVGEVTVTTNATVNSIEKIAEAEEKVVETTKKVEESVKTLKQTVKSTSMTDAEAFNFAIEEASIKSLVKTVKSLGRLEAETVASTNKMGNAIKNIISLVEKEGALFYGGTPTVFGTGTIKFLDDTPINDAKTQTELLTVMIKNASSQAENLASNMSKVKETIKETTSSAEQLVQAVQKVGSPISVKSLLGMSSHLKFPTYTPTQTGVGRTDTIKETNAELDKLISKLKTAKDTVKQTASDVMGFGKEVIDGIRNKEYLPMVLEKVSEGYKKASEGEKQFERQTRRTGETIKKTSSYYNNIFKQLNEWDKSHSVTRPVDSRNLKQWNVWGDGFARSGDNIANTTKSLKTFDNTVLETANDIKVKLVGAMKLFYEASTQMEEKIPDQAFDSWKQAIAEIEGFERRYQALSQRMYDLSRGRGYWQNQGKVSTGYGRTLSDQAILKWIDSYGMGNATIGGQNIKQIIENLTTAQRSVFEASLLGKNGVINTVGYSDYIANISEITVKLNSVNAESQQFKQSLTQVAEAIKLTGAETNRFASQADKAIYALNQMAEANERFSRTSELGTNIGKLQQTLQHFGSLSTKNSETLGKLGEQALILKDRLNVVDEAFKKGTLTEQQYDAEITKITQSLEKLGATASQEIRKLNMAQPEKVAQTTNELKKGKQSLNEFGRTMGQQEKYVDNLYRGLQKARSVIISMKTILRMMGGMAVWNFAFQLVESAKETYIAKNEMESLLDKNTKVNASGVDTYNKALDKTIDRFQKLNKYSLGETGASIGLEFDLNAQEMAKSLPIIAMIQSEYVRAGRTVDEASLAVKDILQGEFMRLSRETGIGKDDLEEKYGWNGDKSDVLGLMKALEKAGKERHWDTFASKATSLNDVLQITTSRFSELGAEIGSHSEPIIVGAFNTILDTVDGLKNSFMSLGSFGKTVFSAGGLTAGILGASSAYLVLAKNMGLADIGTLGLGKSLMASVLQLNRTEVAVHGLGKTLLASLSGTKASTVANIGFTKSLVGRLLGVNQTIIAEKGLGSALVNNISKYKEEIPIIETSSKIKGKAVNLERASILTKDKSASITGKIIQKELTRTQRLAYMTTNLKYNEVAELSRGRAILETAKSGRVLKTVLTGIVGVGLVAWLASVYAWTDKVKGLVEGFNNIADNGDSLVKDAQSAYDNSVQAVNDQISTIDKLKSKNKSTIQAERELNGLVQDRITAYKNLGIVQRANEYVKKKSDALEKKRSKIDTRRQTQRAKALMAVGNTSEEAELQSSTAWIEATGGYYYRNKALNIYNNTYKDLIKQEEAHGLYLKQNQVDQKKVNQFMADFDLKAQEASEHIKAFNEGDIWSGAYYALDLLNLEWIKFTNSPYGDKFFKSIQEFYNWLKPSLDTIIESLKDIGKWAIDGLSWLTSSEMGNSVLSVGLLATGIGVLAWKFKGVRKVLKSLGKTLWDRIKDFKDLNKESGSGKKPNTKTTPEGKKNPDYVPETGEMGLKEGVVSDFKGNVRKYANYATQLAFMMGLITEAIYLIQAPMMALAETGKTFKAKEKSIRAGIEGLKLITPTVIAVLIPVLVLVKVFDHYGDVFNKGSVKTIGSAVVGIVVGLGLVALSIGMLIPSIWALGELGNMYQGVQTQAQKGVEAMKLISESLYYLLPFVPALAGGILLGVAIFESGTLGLALTGAVVAGVAIGMGLVAEAIWTLQAPLWAIGDIGSKYKDLSNVQQGTEALKETAKALKYVEQAMSSFAGITWSNLSNAIANLIAVKLDIDLTELTGEGGFFEQLNTFINDFNTKITIDPIDTAKVETLASSSDGISSIGEAMKKVKTAMNNIPEEFKQNGMSTNDKYNVAVGKAVENTGADATSYFDQFKEPIKQLKKFIDEFNTNEDFAVQPVDPSRLEAINSASDMVTQVNNAVQQVKTAMQGVGDSQWATSQAEGGILGAVGNFLFHQSGEGSINNGQSVGGYKSSLGSSLQELENVVSDLFTFQSNVSNMTGGEGEGANVDGATAMVTTIETAIESLSTSLSNAIPTFEGKGNAISSAIIKGINDGMTNLGTDISTQLATAIDSAKPTAGTYGKGLGWNLKSGFKENAKLKSVVEDEVGYTFGYIDEQEDDFYNKGALLGDALARGFKEHNGLDQQSPGRMARTVRDELGFIGDVFSDGAGLNLPQMASNLAQTLSSNFNPSFGIGSLQLPNLDMFKQGLGQIPSMVSGVQTKVSTDFATIQTNVGNSFNSIVSKTRLSLGTMLSATTKNIGSIRTSWKGMQSALIQSAENIKTQTGQKISKLKTNLGDFWNKIKHPDQLISSFAGGHTGTIRRRGGSSKYLGLYAGGTVSRSQSLFKPRRSRGQPSDNSFNEYLKCISETGSPCYAGWSFNWTPKIQKKFKSWRTNFNAYHLDDFLNVGSFNNSNFPVKGRADIAKQYIFDVIRGTNYAKYFNSNYGDDPVSALRAGAFNCWDGTNIILAIARAFGFEGSRGHGTWNGIGHVWANIPELGIIDPTAIQNRGTFTSSAVKGYHAGSIRRGSGGDVPMGNTYGDINITINNNGEDMTVNEKKIDKETSKKIYDILSPSLSTGL